MTVRDLSDQQSLELTITENLQREDVSPIEMSTPFYYAAAAWSDSLLGNEPGCSISIRIDVHS